MSSEDKDSALVSFLVGFGIGLTAAAIGSLLYAPAPGADTRRRVAEAVNDLRGRAEKVAEQVRATTRDIGERLKQDLDAALVAAKEAADVRRAELERAAHGE